MQSLVLLSRLFPYQVSRGEGEERERGGNLEKGEEKRERREERREKRRENREV